MWRRAHDRFRRAVDRYHQLLERVPPGEVRDRFEAPAASLAALLDEVHEVCLAGQRLAPSEGEDLPGGRGGVLLDGHRALAKAATTAAQAGETVMLAVVAARGERHEEALRLGEAAARTVQQVTVQVARARSLVLSASEE